jgi:mannose-1-phosphate guanylyltransferase
MAKLYGVIMAGGSGTRFWPRSTKTNPKQFHKFGFEKTLLQLTADRIGFVDEMWVVTTELLQKKTKEQLPRATVLAEPMGRNTAACVYWAAKEIAKVDPSGVMVLIPADQIVRDIPQFQRVLRHAIEWATTHDDLVVLGVQPSRPETGFGYIEASEEAPSSTLVRFREKPDLETAQRFLKNSRMLWNAGMFVWRADVILNAFDEHFPELPRAWAAAGGHAKTAYPTLPAISIDYAVMEKARNGRVFRLDCGWDDLGSWRALETLRGTAPNPTVISIGSERCFVDAPEGKTVALLGVEDLLVVDTDEVVFVAHKGRAEEIRSMVEKMQTERPHLV